MIFQKKTALEKEKIKLRKQEQSYLQKQMEKTDSMLNQLLEKKVPMNLQNTLDAAFSKAFYLVFEKGTGIIEKSYHKADMQKEYQINEYAMELKDDRKSYRKFSKKASGLGNVNLVLSGISGVGLGVLGIGIPDIVLFTGLLLKSVYQIALNYGFSYESQEEKRFILQIIEAALSHGEELQHKNEEINYFIENGHFKDERTLDVCISETAGSLSKELLYMKFLQGIPLVGAAGGAFDVVYMKRVTKYAELKYRKRFLQNREKAQL